MSFGDALIAGCVEYHGGILEGFVSWNVMTNYSIPPQKDIHVKFVKGKDITALRSYISDTDGVDCFFLDGAEDAEETFIQYMFFKDFIKPGTLMIAHDWHTEKMAKLRPLVEADSKWVDIFEIHPPKASDL